MPKPLVVSLALASLVGCASPRLLPPSELAPDPPRRGALAVAEPRRMVPIEGVDVAVHDSDPSGTKPAIVCLHAIGHGGGDFASFSAHFEGDFRVVTVDWPGHGASSHDTKPASARRYAEVLLALLDALGLERPILFGNSIGGAAALRVARSHPERVRALVLVNPGGLDPGGFFAGLYIDHLVSRFRRGVSGEARFREWFAEYYADILLGPEARPRRDAIVNAGYESAPRLVEAWTSFKSPDANLRPMLPALRAPVFVGWAMRDGIVQWSRNRDAVESIPGVTLARFEQSGHAPFLEESRAFNAAVAPFLKGLK